MKYAKVTIAAAAPSTPTPTGTSRSPTAAVTPVTVQSSDERAPLHGRQRRRRLRDPDAGPSPRRARRISSTMRANTSDADSGPGERLRAGQRRPRLGAGPESVLSRRSPTQTSFPLNVKRTDGYCPGNAWYDGSSLNFCLRGLGYPNTAFSNVVHHEYGHHIVAVRRQRAGPVRRGHGRLRRRAAPGRSDLGFGFFGDCNSGLRDAENTLQYSVHRRDPRLRQSALRVHLEHAQRVAGVTDPTNYLTSSRADAEQRPAAQPAT